MSAARKLARLQERKETGANNSCPKCHKRLAKKIINNKEYKCCPECGWAEKRLLWDLTKAPSATSTSTNFSDNVDTSVNSDFNANLIPELKEKDC